MYQCARHVGGMLGASAAFHTRKTVAGTSPARRAVRTHAEVFRPPFAYKAQHNKDTLHIKHYIIRTLCITVLLNFSALYKVAPDRLRAQVSMYLENYLWPNFDAKSSSDAHVLSIMAMVVEKFREGALTVWKSFHSRADDFPQFIDRVFQIRQACLRDGFCSPFLLAGLHDPC